MLSSSKKRGMLAPLLAGPRFRQYLSGVGVNRRGSAGYSPRRSRRAKDQPADQSMEQRRIETVGGERQPDPAFGFLDPHRDLQQPQPDGGEFAAGQRLRRRDGVPDFQHQPVGGRVED